jgi:formate dehydrogenase major subunit
VNNDHQFIHRNPDKCILCGLCVRICDELMGVAALGLLGRGFSTVVQPAFNAGLKSSGCISCGQCVSVCPTGALTEKIAGYKQVPLCEDTVQGVCSFCSVGCKTILAAKGDMLLRILPDNSIDKQQILCAKGRFGFTELAKADRITGAFIGGRETGLSEAAVHIHKQMQGIIARHGKGAAAITVSDRLTNEEIALAKQYAESLGIGVYSFSHVRCGVVGGFDADNAKPNCGFDDLFNADVILLAVNDIMDSHTVAGIYIRKAVQNGARLVIINDGASGLADEWCDIKLVSPNNEDMGNVKKAVELYKSAENPVIVFEQNALTEAAGALLAAAGTRAKILRLLPNANSQGLADLGIGYAEGLIEKINAKTLKGLIVFAEDPAGFNLAELEFLCVSSVCMTETAKKTEVILPWMSFAESEGTYTNTVGQVQKLNRAIEPAAGVSNLEVMQGLIGAACVCATDA